MESRSGSEEEKGGGGVAEFCYPSFSSPSSTQQEKEKEKEMVDCDEYHHEIHNSSNSLEATPPPSSSADTFNLTSGIEMIGLPNKSHWKPLFPKDHDGGGGIGSPKNAAATSPRRDQLYLQEEEEQLKAGIMSWDRNNSTNSTPPQAEGKGLSLSLSSTVIGLSHHQQQQQMVMLQQQAAAQGNLSLYQQQQQHHQLELRRSRYLGAAQELLNELCSLSAKQIITDHTPPARPRPNHPLQIKSNHWDVADITDDDDEDGGIGSTTTSSRIHNNNNNYKPPPALASFHFLELQKRKTKLFSLLQQVDSKYRHYCSQMKGVVWSFEAVAGSGAARVYSALASKAMSRHFRCVRDGIVGEIQETRKAMGEKLDDDDPPGTTRGETPRLKVIDQTLRQQRAFQQMNMMESQSHPWRPQRGLPDTSVTLLRAWLFDHFLHPYPSDVDKHIIARQTGLSRSQVSNWFINARVRLWKPMVEELYMEETKDHQDNFLINNNNNNQLMLSTSDGAQAATFDDNHHHLQANDDNMHDIRLLSSSDQKPTQDQLIRIDSDCLSSIISNPDHNYPTTNRTSMGALAAAKAFQTHQHMPPNHGFGSFGAVDLDHFSTYNHHHSAGGGVSYTHDHLHHSSSSVSHVHQQPLGGVSLTLGLHQHGGNNNGGGGVSLAFTPASQTSNNIFFPRDHFDQQQHQVHHQYSLLEGDQGQNLPYRNLMGAQLLHDFSG